MHIMEYNKRQSKKFIETINVILNSWDQEALWEKLILKKKNKKKNAKSKHPPASDSSRGLGLDPSRSSTPIQILGLLL